MAAIYEQRVVMFIDILGFRDLINQKRETELLDALAIAEELQERFSEKTSSIRVTAFSDSIVISDRIIGDGDGFGRIIQIATYVWLRFLGRGIMTRGGIAVGELHHEQGRVFGPAMNEAYELESSHAIYPRIVVSDAVHLGATHWFGNPSLPDELRVELPKLLRQDFDGIWHVHTLGPMVSFPSKFIPPERHSEARPLFKRATPNFDRLRTIAVLRTVKQRPINNVKVAVKYDWLYNYFRSPSRSGMRWDE